MRAHRHHRVSGAMPAANKTNDARLAGCPQNHPLRCLGRIGSCQPKPGFLLDFSGNQIHQSLGQIDCRSIDAREQTGQGRTVELSRNCLFYMFVGIPKSRRGPASAEIDKAFSVIVDQIGAVAARRHERRVTDFDRVGHIAGIAPDQRATAHRSPPQGRSFPVAAPPSASAAHVLPAILRAARSAPGS